MHPILSGIRTSAILLSFAGLSYGGYRYGVRFGNLDPFAKFRGIGQINMQAGIQLDNVEMKAYRLGNLVAKAKIKTVTVTQDRNDLQMTEIHDGLYRGKSDVLFECLRGSYNLPLQQLDLRGDAHVSGKDFNLRTAVASISRRDSKLMVPTAISGTLLGGKISAASFNYSGKMEDADLRYVRWQGKLPVKTEIPGQESVSARSWEIDSDHLHYKKGGLISYTNCKATDGEVLIYAPVAELDKNTEVLTATGRVTYFSGKADVIADKVVVYRKEKRAFFTGNVIMLVKPKKDQDRPPSKEEIPEIKKVSFGDKLELPKDPSVLSAEDKEKAEQLRSGKNLRDYPLHLQAQTITYWYGKGSRHAEFSGDPVAKQDFPSGQWRMGWSNSGTYDGEKEILHLSSKDGARDVKYKNSTGDLALAKAAEFSTNDQTTEDDQDLEFWDVSGIYKDTSGEDDRAKKDQKPGTSPSPPAEHRGPPTTGGKPVGV